MKTPTTQTRHFRSIISQPMLALAFASVISAMAMTPALAAGHDNRQGNWHNSRGNGGYKGNGHSYHDEWHGYHGRGNSGYKDNGHGYHDEWHGYHGERHGYQPPYYYRKPSHSNAYIYVPPVYYAPVPSPGITLIFPIDIR
jgi:hypothetical protein